MLLESFVSLSAQGIIQRGRQRTLLCPSRMPTGLHNMCIPGLIVTLWPLGLQNSYNSFTICHNKAEALFIHYFPHSLCPSIFSFRPSFTAWKQSSFQAAHIFWQASCFLPPQVLHPYSASFSFFFALLLFLTEDFVHLYSNYSRPNWDKEGQVPNLILPHTDFLFSNLSQNAKTIWSTYWKDMQQNKINTDADYKWLIFSSSVWLSWHSQSNDMRVKLKVYGCCQS